MFERFTDSAKSVVEHAVLEAVALDHSMVGTEHLLLGLLDPHSGGPGRLLAELGLAKAAVYADITAFRSPLPGVLDKEDAEALESIGIDLPAVLNKIESRFGAVPTSSGRRRRWYRRRECADAETARRRPRFAPRSKKVLELSLREAVRLKHNYIGPEHILLGVLREGDGLAMRILAERGFDAGDLRRRTEALLPQAA
ncbi:MAG: Clp protease N-terminal domain-containing protein [Mycobacteriales bacterium]